LAVVTLHGWIDWVVVDLEQKLEKVFILFCLLALIEDIGVMVMR